MKELQLNVVLDTTKNLKEVIDSSKEHSIGTPVAIHIDRIPLVNSLDELLAYDSSITLVGPERKWVFDIWRVKDIEITTPLVSVDLSYIEAKEYIVLRPIFRDNIAEGYYGIENVEDTSEIYYTIPIPDNTDTMVWIENLDTIVMTSMSKVVNYNLHMLRGSEKLESLCILENIKTNEDTITICQTSVKSLITTTHQDGIVIIPSSNEEDGLLKTTILNYRYKDQPEFYKQNGNMKYDSYIDNDLIIAPKCENAIIGWFMSSIEDSPGSLNKNSNSKDDLAEISMERTYSLKEYNTDELDRATMSYYYPNIGKRTIVKIDNIDVKPVEINYGNSKIYNIFLKIYNSGY